MEQHYTLTDIQFEKQFKSCLIDPAVFTHETHLRLAWIFIQKYGVDMAVDKIRFQLRNFVDNAGARNKYNETVTKAAVKAVFHFMLTSKTNNFKDFITENARLKNNFKGLLACHFKTDICISPLAKGNFLALELLPFD